MKKHTIEYVKQVFEKEGYILLSTEYKNSCTKLDIMCDKGHQYQATYNAFQSGYRCPICANNIPISYDNVKKCFEQEHYTLISTSYKNNRTKLNVICPEGHKWYTSYNNFQIGNRCNICSGTKKHSFEYVKDFIEQEGYILLSNNYKNNKSKLKIQCPQGHIYNVSFNGFSRGDRCPICASLQTVSKAEKDVVDYIKKIYNGLLIENDRTQIINPKTNCFLELDIFLPDINKAIEYNGMYWHSSNYSVYKDNVKKEQCKQKNIGLLIITDLDWMNDRPQCESIINNFIRGNS